MNAQTILCFKNIERSAQIARLVDTKSRRLARLCPGVTRFQVILERPHANHQSGNEIRARVRVVAPGSEAVGRARETGEAGARAAHAVAEAFRAAERQLKSRAVRAHASRTLGCRCSGREEYGDAT